MDNGKRGRTARTADSAVMQMDERIQLVMFRLDEQRYALPLSAVERVVHAVEVTPLPGAPSIVLGAIDMAGCILPVLNLRRRFLLPEREIGLADQFLIARAGRRLVALVIDEAQGVIADEQAAVTGSDRIVPGLDQFHGVVKLDDGLVLIHDLEKFLSLDEARALDAAISQEG